MTVKDADATSTGSDEAATAEPTFEPSGFDDYKPGDTMRFLTANNGFGGTGDPVVRVGTVLKVTAKTIVLDCAGHWFGKRAVVRRAEWDARCPMKGPSSTTDDKPRPARAES